MCKIYQGNIYICEYKDECCSYKIEVYLDIIKVLICILIVLMRDYIYVNIDVDMCEDDQFMKYLYYFVLWLKY